MKLGKWYCPRCQEIYTDKDGQTSSKKGNVKKTSSDKELVENLSTPEILVGVLKEFGGKATGRKSAQRDQQEWQ